MTIDYAFQPIVNTTTLTIHGFEALGRPAATTAEQLLDRAFAEGSLAETESALVTAAVKRFCGFGLGPEARLFCNIDNRLFHADGKLPRAVAGVADRFGMPRASLCFELSERLPPESLSGLEAAVEALHASGVRIAIDDFGNGFSGLHMLMRAQPHYVKIDRYFIDNIAFEPRKQVVVANIIRMAHSLGFSVVAEGVERADDFRVVRDIGCELAQGFLLAKPLDDIRGVTIGFDEVACRPIAGSGRLRELAELIPTLTSDAPLAELIEIFSSSPSTRIVPILDAAGQPLGAVHDTDVRSLLVNEFGKSLISNKAYARGLAKLVRRCPACDVNATIESVIDNYVTAGGTEGLILTLDGRYAGFLSSHALMKLIAEREVAIARDQNPLTHLSGNESITRHIARQLEISRAPTTFAYLDFDNFKAFNDTYGFLMGDRALRMFAEMLDATAKRNHGFAGHIGGDDFFLSLPLPLERARPLVTRRLERFRENVASLYDPETRARGHFTAADRSGKMQQYGLMRVSAAVLELPEARGALSDDMIIRILAAGKHLAKRSESRVHVCDPASTDARTLQGDLDKRLTA